MTSKPAESSYRLGDDRPRALPGSLFQQGPAVHANPWSYGSSALVNGGMLALLLCIGLQTRRPLPLPGQVGKTNLNNLSITAPKFDRWNGGNGGGTHDLLEPNLGRPPRFDRAPILPPQAPVLDNPRLPVNPAVALDLKLPDNPALPNLGVLHSANVIRLSNGPGGDAGMGSGQHGVYGPGSGPGPYGPGNGLYRPGVGGVSQPIPIVTPEAEFSDEARRAKYQGVCMVSVIVDAEGNPRNPRVVQALGMGLDEKAVAAVLGYRFKPARKDGKPVPVIITVAVNFHLL